MPGYFDQYRYSYSGTDCRAYAFFPSHWEAGLARQQEHDTAKAALAAEEAAVAAARQALNTHELQLFDAYPDREADYAKPADDPAYNPWGTTEEQANFEKTMELESAVRVAEQRLEQARANPALAAVDPYIHHLESIHTVSFSLHEPKGMARALGYRSVKGFARSTRTIAGTLIFTVVEGHPLEKLIAADINTYNEYTMNGWSIDAMTHGRGTRLDPNNIMVGPPTILTPFNLVLHYVSEIVPMKFNLGEPYLSTGSGSEATVTIDEAAGVNRVSGGNVSLTQRHDDPSQFDMYMDPYVPAVDVSAQYTMKTASLMLKDVEIVGEGVVTSVNDMVTEITMNFIARDFCEFSALQEDRDMGIWELPRELMAKIGPALEAFKASDPTYLALEGVSEQANAAMYEAGLETAKNSWNANMVDSEGNISTNMVQRGQVSSIVVDNSSANANAQQEFWESNTGAGSGWDWKGHEAASRSSAYAGGGTAELRGGSARRAWNDQDPPLSEDGEQQRPAYDYFCGANVIGEVGGSGSNRGMPILEAAGISYNYMNSMQPIYGYSSMMFDAVAPGQRLVQGTIAVNFVTSNYLYEGIRQGPLIGDPNVGFTEGNTVETSADFAALFDNVLTAASQSEGFTNSDNTSVARMNALEDALSDKYWGPEENLMTEAMVNKDITLAGPFNINITFGGKHRIKLLSCFIIGRSSTIQIDENVILEEYPFFARSLITGNYQET